MPDIFAARIAVSDAQRISGASPVAGGERPRAKSGTLSVVVPLCDEEATLPTLYRRLIAALEPLHSPFELVFVDDGSRDSTPHLLAQLTSRDRRVVVVDLSRNFGHQAAVTAGLEQARGDAVIVMDGDLQDPPEVLPRFVEKWQAGFEVVYAVRTKRKEGHVKRLGYHAFYRLLRAVGDIDIPLDSGDFCLMDRTVVDALAKLPERVRFVRGLRTFVGFRQTGLPYERAARAAGAPKYTFRKLVALAIDGIVNFSGAPLRWVSYAGVLALLAAVGAGLTAVLVANALLGLLAAVLFVGAGQFLALGIVGAYLRRIFLEVKGRPPYIVRSVQRNSAAIVRAA